MVSLTTGKNLGITNYREILFSIPLSLLILFWIIRALEIYGLVTFQTIYRLTGGVRFHIYLTGSFLTDDLVIVLLGVLVCLILFHKNKKNDLLLPYALAGGLLTGIVACLIFNNPAIADVLAIITLPAVLFLYIKSNKYDLPKRITKNVLVLTLSGVFLAIEIFSLVTWIGYPIFPSQIYSEPRWYGAQFEAQLFYALGLLSPSITALLFFSYGIKPSIGYFKELLSAACKSLKSKQSHSFHHLHANDDSGNHFTINRRVRIIAVFLSLLLAASLSVYPYMPSINPGFQNLSVDTPYYINQLNNIQASSIFSERSPLEFANERALSILVFYGLTAAIGQSAEYIVPLLPILLNILSVLAAYFLGRQVFGKNHVAVIFIPILTALSIQLVVGIYGGFFSNMLAIPLSFAAIIFLLRYLGNRTWVNLGIFVIATFSILLTHVFTWLFLMTTIIISIVIFSIIYRREETLKDKVRLYVPIMVTFALGVSTVTLIASLVSGVSGLGYISDLVSTNISSNYFAERWFNFNYTFRAYLGGFLTNPVMTLLALIWALGADYKNRFNVIILSSMFIASFFFFFGDPVTQSRVLYNIPLHIPAAIVLAGILTGRHLSFLPPLTRSALVSLVIMHLSNYSLRSLANLNPIPV